MLTRYCHLSTRESSNLVLLQLLRVLLLLLLLLSFLLCMINIIRDILLVILSAIVVYVAHIIRTAVISVLSLDRIQCREIRWRCWFVSIIQRALCVLLKLSWSVAARDRRV